MSSQTEAARGRFITFEGLDGSGKSTQLERLATRLRELGYDVVTTQEPGGTAIGRQIRELLLSTESRELSPTAELLLMFASRAQNVDQVILPAIAAGKLVLCDRFTDSTLAYQGAGRELGAELVLELDRIACRGLVPDLTILIDVKAEVGLERARNRAEEDTRFEQYDLAFHRRVRQAFLQLAGDESRRVVQVDGEEPIDAVAASVAEVVAAELGLELD